MLAREDDFVSTADLGDRDFRVVVGRRVQAVAREETSNGGGHRAVDVGQSGVTKCVSGYALLFCPSKLFVNARPHRVESAVVDGKARTT